MRNRILMTTIILASLIGGIGWINSQAIPTRIILKPGTTLEQAASEFANLNLFNIEASSLQDLPAITSFGYTHKFEDQFSLSGALTFEQGKDNLINTRNKYAQKYSEYKKERLREIQKGPVYEHLLSINDGKRPDYLQNQIDRLQREVNYIIENIDGCWSSNTCPPIEIRVVDALFTDHQQIEQIKAIPQIESIETESRLEQIAFFLNRIYERSLLAILT